MNLRNTVILFFSVCFLTAIFYSCEIKQPTAPNWVVDLNLPFTNKSYNILDIVKRSGNIGIDSSNNNIVFLYGESDYQRKFGEDIKFDGLKTTDITAPSTRELDTFIIVDDSTFITRTDFLNGDLNFSFFNSSGNAYVVDATIKNLFTDVGNDTEHVTFNVPSGNTKTIDLNLADFYLKNDLPDNKFRIRLTFKSAQPVAVNFSYSLSPYSIKSVEGRLKPLVTGITSDEVTDPFGSDVPEGEVNFANITPNKNFLILKKYADVYQVDFTRISIIGENKSGKRVRLKYLRNGNAGDPVDSVFNLTLPSNKDSIAFPINENNSNIRQFINNIPKKISLTRTDYLNLPYAFGKVTYTDSLTLKFLIQVPLDMSISSPVVFRDTVNAGISDSDQRQNLDYSKNLFFAIDVDNGFPLKATAKILVLDSFFKPLLPISKIVSNLPDSSVILNAAFVGSDGFVNTHTTTSLQAELDSTQIQLLKHMGKIIYEYKLYTDPNIPAPLTSVKIRGNDLIHESSYGRLKYLINFK